MLTPIQIKEKTFQQSGRNAYRSEDVNAFMQEVFASYDQMFRENGELLRRVSLLAERLEQYREDEDSIKAAVITAQRAADRIVKEATERAELLTREATDILTAATSEADTIRRDTENGIRTELRETLENARADAAYLVEKATKDAKNLVMKAEDDAKDILGHAHRAVTSESILFDMIKKEVSEFKADVMAKYKAHIEIISQLPEIAGQKADQTMEKAPEEPVPEEAVQEESVPEAATTAPEEAVPEEVMQEELVPEEAVQAEPAPEEVAPLLEFVDVSDEDVITPFEAYTPPPVQETAPVQQSFTPPEVPVYVAEPVLETPIPFKTDESSAELEFIKEDEMLDGVLDVSAFIENYGEKPEAPRKRGFSLDLSKVTEQEPAVIKDAAPDDTGAGLFGAEEEMDAPVFDSRESAKSAPPDSASAEQDDEADEKPGRFFAGRREDLKRRFSVISMSDDDDDDDDDDEDGDGGDDDDGGDPPTLRGFFKKKK